MNPSKRLVWLLLALSISAGLLPFLPLLANPVKGLIALLAALTLWDWWQLRKPIALEVNRLLPEAVPQGQSTQIQLRVNSYYPYDKTVIVHDLTPADIVCEGMPRKLTLSAGSQHQFSYQLQTKERGDLAFTAIDIVMPSVLGLWSRRLRYPLEQTLAVYPNFAALQKYTLLASHNQLSQMGIRKIRRRGEGQSFHQLREYRDGDSLRQVDWKASSRVRKLISREYQEEKDQRVFFALDCSRRMRARDGDLAHFDHALTAMLLLAQVALRQGDAVGLSSFGSNQPCTVAPIKGKSAIKTLLNAVYPLQPQPTAADYSEWATQLLSLQRKRSLIVLITNLRDDDTAELAAAMRLLQRHHLVLIANLHEPQLDALYQQPVEDLEQAVLYGSNVLYNEQRRKAESQLQQLGLLALNTTPTQLAPNLINRYMEIKQSGWL